MANSCILIPTIKVGNKEIESKLFKELTSFTGNRESTKLIWGLTQIPAFIDSLQGIERDENGEPTLASLNKALNITELLKGNTALIDEKQAAGAIDYDNKVIEYKTPEEAITKATQFNQFNLKFVADVERSNSNYIITVKHKNLDNMNRPNELMFNSALNNRLRGIMRGLGFDVEVKEDLTYDGIFNPLDVTTTVDGLKTVIQIAKGQRGEEAFPEEFSHFMIEGLINEPLVSRLINSLSAEMVEKILGEDYSKYSIEYNGNLKLLQKEAAGKLLQQHITKQPVETSHTLLERLWNFIKIKFSRFQMIELDRNIHDANNEFAKLASLVQDESVISLFKPHNVLDGATLYKIGSEVNKMQKIAEDAVNLSSRRMRLMMLRSKNSGYKTEDLNIVKAQQEFIDKKKYANSSLLFLNSSLVEIEKLNNQLHKLKNIDTRSDSDLSKINSVSTVVRSIKEFSEAYDGIIKQMMSLEAMQESNDVNITKEDARAISNKAAEVYKIITAINSNYEELRYNTVFNFLSLFWGKDKIKTLSNNKEEILSLEMILKMADKDINGADRWLGTLSSASDPLLSLIDKVFKVTQANRDRVLEDVLSDVRGIHNKLIKAGYNTDFMFEKDKNNKLTGRIISDINFVKFNEERTQYIESLKEQKLDYFKTQSKIEAWERRHTEAVVIDQNTGRVETLPAKSLYGIEVLKNLTPAQREYYDAMLAAKSTLDQLLPARYTNTYNAIQVRNDMIEAMSDNMDNPKKAFKLAMENLKDNFLRRSDDTEFGERGNKQGVALDLTGKAIQKLPIYYTTPLEDMDRLSTDFSSSMLAYASMAINYNEMNKVIDALELTRDLVKDREVKQLSGDKQLIESYKILKKQFDTPYTKTGANTNIGARLDDYYASNLYGQRKKDHGSFKIPLVDADVDLAKLGDAVKSYTSIMGMGLNVFSSISNVLIGDVQAFIEGIGGEFFTIKDTAIAKKNYAAMMPRFMAELNSTLKTNKLDLLINRFNALDDFQDSLKREGFYKSPISRILGNTGVFIGQQAGEHYLHSRTMLAMLNHYKVKDKLGNEMSLFEAFEVEKIKEGSKLLTAKLVLKEGVTKLDGSTITDNDITNLKMKISRVNQSLNGAFSEEDKGAIHRHVVGRLIMQFRQWMPEHYARRFAGAYYDSNLDQYREGYYTTMGKISLNLIKDLSKGKFELATNWNNLTQHERANLRRALAEIGIFAALTTILQLMGPVKEKKGKWAERMLIYQLQRMKLEIGASAPVTWDAIDNIFTLVQQPAAAIKGTNTILNLVQFQNMATEIESGRYKGWSEYRRDFMNALPLYGQLRKTYDLADEDYMFTMFTK